MNAHRPDRKPITTDEVETRRTVIPTPRANAMFPGWGVRF
jgi:hypothetical protein